MDLFFAIIAVTFGRSAMRITYQHFIWNLVHSLFFLFIFLPSAHASNACAPTTYTPKVFNSSFDSPNQITTDGLGNVWVRNGNNTITKISATNPDSPIVYSGTSHKFSTPFSIAADVTGNLWILNFKEKNVTKLPVENPDIPVVYGLGSAKAPRLMAVDSSSNVWVTDAITRKLIKLPVHTPTIPVEISRPEYKITTPWNMIAGGSGDIWVASQRSMTVFNNPLFYHVFSGPKYQLPSQAAGLATDSDGNFYVADSIGNRVVKIITTDPAANPVIFSDPSYQFNQPFNVAVDSQGNVWVANLDTVTQIPATSPTVPIVFSPRIYQFGYLGGLAVDVQGNVWLANIADNTVTELIASKNPC